MVNDTGPLERAVTLETQQTQTEKDLNEIKEGIKNLDEKMTDLTNKFTPIYVFMAVYTTATIMANFKDFVAFFK
mgnify:CR=1 FL=1